MINKYRGSLIIIIIFINGTIGGLSKAWAQVNQLGAMHTKTHAAAHETKKAKQGTTTIANPNGSFVPIPLIITDQNLGYGGILALSYLHASEGIS